MQFASLAQSYDFCVLSGRASGRANGLAGCLASCLLGTIAERARRPARAEHALAQPTFSTTSGCGAGFAAPRNRRVAPPQPTCADTNWPPPPPPLCNQSHSGSVGQLIVLACSRTRPLAGSQAVSENLRAKTAATLTSKMDEDLQRAAPIIIIQFMVTCFGSFAASHRPLVVVSGVVVFRHFCKRAHLRPALFVISGQWRSPTRTRRSSE